MLIKYTLGSGATCTLPTDLPQHSRDLLTHCTAQFGFLLNTPELRGETVSLLKLAELMTQHSSNELVLQRAREVREVVFKHYRTPELDVEEQRRVTAAADVVSAGLEAADSFEYEGMAIHNPYRSSCGRFTVEPLEAYGDAYVEWYLRGQDSD